MDKKTYVNLHELTGNESGAVQFDNGEILITNWAHIEGLPRIFGMAVIGMGEELTAEPCDPPEEVVEAMRAEEWNTSGTFSKDGWSAWKVTTDSGEVVIAVTQASWN